nr:unnamed protein product [Digitaria exilis]
MGRAPCCDRSKGLKKGPWTPEEDKLLVDYIQTNGHGSWRLLPKLAGQEISDQSKPNSQVPFLRNLLPVLLIGFFRCWFCYLRWSMIAAQLPGRTDNEIKNYWNTHLKKQLRRMGLDDPPPGPASGCPAARHMAQWETARLEAEARLSLAAASSSSSGAAPTGTTTTSVSSSSAVAEKDPKAADIFLRLWSSDIGDSFRRRKATEAAPPPLLMPAAPVVKRKDVVVIKQEEAQALPSGPGGDDSSAASSNETEAMEEMEGYYDYQTFVDNFAGEELGLFHGRYGGFSLFPPIDVLAEASLDTAF